MEGTCDPGGENRAAWPPTGSGRQREHARLGVQTLRVWGSATARREDVLASVLLRAAELPWEE